MPLPLPADRRAGRRRDPVCHPRQAGKNYAEVETEIFDSWKDVDVMTTTATRVVTSPMYVVLPAEDLARAREFYSEKIGFEFQESPGGLMGMAGNGTGVFIYERARTKAEHTVALFVVPDVVEAVSELSSRGVQFEDYPELGTVNGIASLPDGSKAAWFTDSEGNILNIVQM
jgi:predicted enzyme related to lactoylglutathione lyase